MRDIRFRAWDKEEKVMVYFGPLTTLVDMTTLVGLCTEFHEYMDDCQAHEDGVEDVEIMQYTGLKDSKGVEIYEGDIVHEYCSNPNVDWTYEVYYDNDEARFWLKNENEIYGQWNTYDDPACPSWNAYEVIGNIYENPELIAKLQ